VTNETGQFLNVQKFKLLLFNIPLIYHSQKLYNSILKMRKGGRRLQGFLAFSVNDRHLSVNGGKKQAGLGKFVAVAVAVGSSSKKLAL